MCGIAGIFDAAIDVREYPLDAMRDSLRHRGPDDFGTWIDQSKHIALCHRRLSIIDTSSAGKQPMVSQDGALVLTFNGEIYNYIELRNQLRSDGYEFRTESDSEVILVAYRKWGADCVDHFIGMFAFCILDKQKNAFFIARDHVGEKPLYYFFSEDKFCFSSELKALLKLPFVKPEMSMDGLQSYLAYGNVVGQQSMFNNVAKLLPGHSMTVSLADLSFQIKQFWSLPTKVENPVESLDEAVDRLEIMLRGSIKRQLRADVPVGVLLSGGIDSSVITALASEVSSQPIKTFTISFKGHGRFDDGPYAKIVADHFNTDHNVLVADTMSTDVLQEVVSQFDEPIADHAIVPFYVLSKMVTEHVTVALGGDGGDELFGGYPQHSYILKQEKIRQYLPSPIRSSIANIAQYLPVGYKGRNHLLGVSGDIDNAVAHVGMYFDVRSRVALSSHLKGLDSPESLKCNFSKCVEGARSKMMFSDFQTTLPNGYLVKIDRASMMNSLELRSPWLDREIVDFAAKHVPMDFKATAKEKKIIPRMLGRKILPSRLDLNRKQGLTMPLDNWFKGDWGNYCEDVLKDQSVDYLDRGYIDKLFKLQKKGLNNSNRIMSLTFLELWRRQYHVQIS